MKLLEYIDHVNAHPLVVDIRRRDHFYPSGASMKVENAWGEREVIGRCLRSQWYSMTASAAELSEIYPADSRRMDYGTVIHEYEIDRMKKANVYVADDVRFYDPENNVSGRVDAFVFNPYSKTEPKEIIGVEIKTTGSYSIIRDTITGHDPQPLADHVVQVMVYADFYKSRVKTWVIMYFDRISGKSRQHIMVLTDGKVSINGQLKQWRVASIYERWKLLQSFLDTDQPPPRDYEMKYSHEKILTMRGRQQLSRAEITELEKGRHVDKGDIQCRMCAHRVKCCQPSPD